MAWSLSAATTPSSSSTRFYALRDAHDAQQKPVSGKIEPRIEISLLFFRFSAHASTIIGIRSRNLHSQKRAIVDISNVIFGSQALRIPEWSSISEILARQRKRSAPGRHKRMCWTPWSSSTLLDLKRPGIINDPDCLEGRTEAVHSFIWGGGVLPVPPPPGVFLSLCR